MNSLPPEILTTPYALRAVRDMDLEALPHIFPESGSFGPSLSDRRNWLRQVEDVAWGQSRHIRVVMEELSSGRAIAGFTIDRIGDFNGQLRYGFRPSTAMTQIAGFVMMKELAFNDLGMIALRADMIGGRDPLAQIHQQIGYRQAVRLRDWWRDPDGSAHDLITYEAVNPEWKK